MAATTNICVLCGNSASGANRSREHIIPKALGGRWTVSGFTCLNCNIKAGDTIDKALAKSFEDMIRLLEISRENPLPLSRRVHRLSDGTPVRTLSSNRAELAYPIIPKEITQGSQIVARSMDELRHIIQTMNDRRNAGIDVGATMRHAMPSSRYVNEAIRHEAGAWGMDEYRSLVKSALAMAFRAGVDTHSAELAVAYLTESVPTACVFQYYKKDLMNLREFGMPINCVSVKGDPTTRELIAYVEIFGMLRTVMRLSKEYDGGLVECHYAFNAADGQELDVLVDLSSEVLAEAECDSEPHGPDMRDLHTTIVPVIARAKSVADVKELLQVTVSAVNEFYVEVGKASEEPLTEAKFWEFILRAAVEYYAPSGKVPGEALTDKDLIFIVFLAVDSECCNLGKAAEDPLSPEDAYALRMEVLRSITPFLEHLYRQ